MKTVDFPEIEAHTMPTSPPTLVHHHTTITLPHIAPEQLAYFSFGDVLPREVRVHFWTTGAGFPANALCFCTHLDSERTTHYKGTGGTIAHNPELVKGAPPSSVVCGHGPIEFMVELNRFLWEELQNPVQGLVGLRVAVLTHIIRMLEDIMLDGPAGR